MSNPNGSENPGKKPRRRRRGKNKQKLPRLSEDLTTDEGDTECEKHSQEDAQPADSKTFLINGEKTKLNGEKPNHDAQIEQLKSVENFQGDVQTADSETVLGEKETNHDAENGTAPSSSSSSFQLWKPRFAKYDASVSINRKSPLAQNLLLESPIELFSTEDILSTLRAVMTEWYDFDQTLPLFSPLTLLDRIAEKAKERLRSSAKYYRPELAKLKQPQIISPTPENVWSPSVQHGDKTLTHDLSENLLQRAPSTSSLVVPQHNSCRNELLCDEKDPHIMNAQVPDNRKMITTRRGLLVSLNESEEQIIKGSMFDHSFIRGTWALVVNAAMIPPALSSSAVNNAVVTCEQEDRKGKTDKADESKKGSQLETLPSAVVDDNVRRTPSTASTENKKGEIDQAVSDESEKVSMKLKKLTISSIASCKPPDREHEIDRRIESSNPATDRQIFASNFRQVISYLGTADEEDDNKQELQSMYECSFLRYGWNDDFRPPPKISSNSNKALNISQTCSTGLVEKSVTDDEYKISPSNETDDKGLDPTTCSKISSSDDHRNEQLCATTLSQRKNSDESENSKRRAISTKMSPLTTAANISLTPIEVDETKTTTINDEQGSSGSLNRDNDSDKNLSENVRRQESVSDDSKYASENDCQEKSEVRGEKTSLFVTPSDAEFPPQQAVDVSESRKSEIHRSPRGSPSAYASLSTSSKLITKRSMYKFSFTRRTWFDMDFGSDKRNYSLTSSSSSVESKEDFERVDQTVGCVVSKISTNPDMLSLSQGEDKSLSESSDTIYMPRVSKQTQCEQSRKLNPRTRQKKIKKPKRR